MMQPTASSLKIEDVQTHLPLLTAEDLATRLLIHRNKVYRMVNSGEIPGIQVGGVWRFEWDAVLDALMKRSKNGNERP